MSRTRKATKRSPVTRRGDAGAAKGARVSPERPLKGKGHLHGTNYGGALDSRFSCAGASRILADPMPDVVTFGEIMLRLTSPGHLRLVQAPHFEITLGGA